MDKFSRKNTLEFQFERIKDTSSPNACVGDQATHGKFTTGMNMKMRQPQKIGTWNVRGLLQTGKLTILQNELIRCNINICGLSETHWKGNGHFMTNEHIVYFSGNDNEGRSNNGVGFIMPKSLKEHVIGYETVNDRIISIKLKSTPENINLIQIYAPTSAAENNIVKAFYSELENTISKIPNREMLIVMGDFNA